MSKKDIFGVKTRVYPTRSVRLLKNGSLYMNMVNLSLGQRKLLDYILHMMEVDTNLIQLGGDTRRDCIKQTGLSDKSISNLTSELKSLGYIDKCYLPKEYLIHPTFAICGNEYKIYGNTNSLESELRS